MQIEDVVFYDKECINLVKTSNGIEVLDEEFKPIQTLQTIRNKRKDIPEFKDWE